MDIALETVCHIINQARTLAADMHELSDEPGRHAADDTVKDELPEEDTGVGAGESDELRDFIESLNVDEQSELVALAWIGRGTFTEEDWDEAVETARDEHGKRACEYLLSLPLLADYLEEGLNAFDLSCEDAE